MDRPSNGRPLRFAIIGAGMAGILAAIKLREAGYDDFTIYEKAERLGGTWRENTYPGIACDVPSHLYSYSFEPNPDWSHRFSPGPEIQSYFEGVAHRYGVSERIRCGAEVTRLEFRDGRWQLELRDGRRDAVDVVIAATGVLHHPKWPEYEGLDRFEGALFHSAAWDHAVKIDGRRVGLVGTGSSAVQITSAIVDRVAKLALFQRTAQWIMPQENPAYSDAERAEFRRDPAILDRMHADMAVLFAAFSNGLVDANSPQMKAIEGRLPREPGDQRARPGAARAAAPELQGRLQAPGDVARFLPRGADAAGRGGDRADRARRGEGRAHARRAPPRAGRAGAGHRLPRRPLPAPIQVAGRGGRTLDQVWRERPGGYLSISIPEFPNLFMLNGPNGPVGNFSLIEVAELQFGYVLQLVDLLRQGRCREISPSQAATAQLEAERTEAARHTIWGSGCRSWYLDDRGVPMSWPWTFDRFRAEMAAPKLEAFELR